MAVKKITSAICIFLCISVFCLQAFGCGEKNNSGGTNNGGNGGNGSSSIVNNNGSGSSIGNNDVEVDGVRYKDVNVKNGGYKTSVTFDTYSPIVKDGTSDYIILIGDSANEAEKHAAAELSSYIAQISGVEIPVYNERFINNADTSMKIISVGNTALKKNRLNYDNVDFNNDGFVIKTVDNTLFIFGGESKRGTIYAVYEYLETCCGCRFFMPEVEKVPKAKNVYLPVIDMIEIPTFGLREVVYNTMLDGTFSTKARLTGEIDIIGENKTQYGEIHSDYFWSQAHNIATTIVPISVYGESHPEWYYYDNNVSIYNFDYTYGVNDDGSYKEGMDVNPVDVAVESLKKGLIESDAYYLNCSQADTADTCENPIYLARKERIQASGTILQFLNLVCERLDAWITSETRPDGLFPNGREYKILNFAYGHTQTPPITNGEVVVKAHKNILTWLAPIEFNGLYPYNDRQNQISYVPGLFDGWTKCVDSFGLWDYYACFAVNPCMYYSPYLSTAGNNYRFYADLGNINYVFSELSGGSDWQRNEFDEIKTYCASKLLWNPYKYNMNDLVKEYCEYVFGDQSAAVLQVITANEDNFALLTSSDYNYRIDHSKLPWTQFFPLSLVENNIKILNKAIDDNAKSDSPAEVKERVDLRLKKFKITIASHLLFEYDSYYPVSDINKKKAFTDEFFDLIEETKFNEYYGKWNNTFYDNLYARFKIN